MVTTFNKRELLEFPNYLKDLSGFPKDFYLLIKSKDYTDNEFQLVLNFLNLNEFVTETGKSFKDFAFDFNRSKYDIIITPQNKTFITQISSLDTTWPTKKIGPHQFKGMSASYAMPYLTDDELKYWLYNVKGIRFGGPPMTLEI